MYSHAESSRRQALPASGVPAVFLTPPLPDAVRNRASEPFAGGVFGGQSSPEVETGSALSERAEPEPGGTILAGKRIVIVEDEGVTQMFLRRTLSRAGLTIAAVAATGESGIEAVLRERPDLVLMDISMPGEIDGLEATRQILQEYRVCIIVLSAFATPEYQERARASGASDYLLKPIPGHALLPQLEAAYTRFHEG